MDQSKLKNALEIATNIAVLIVALLLVGNFAWVHLARKSALQPESGLRRGDTFSLIPGVDYTKSPQTLIIALSARCEHCNKSIPCFKKILNANSESGNTIQITAVFPEPADEVRQYLFAQEFSVNVAVGIPLKALHLPGTPSAVLIDKEGKILNFWLGEPSRDTEKEILDAIKQKD